MRILKLVGVIVLFLLAGAIAYFLFHEPRNDRAWDLGFSRLTTIAHNADGTMAFHDVRDFTYDGTKSRQAAWKNLTINPDDVIGAHFFLNRFSSAKQVGHTFISFDMKDGSTIAFSIEARREATEKYTFIGGFLQKYEVQYLWGMERDFVTERIAYRVQPVEMYTLSITPADAEALFKSFAEETDALDAHPRFYNTLTANCTNLLAKIINRHYPGTLPYDIAWNLPGFTPEYLTREGYITGQTPETADLSRFHDAIAGMATSSPEAFSAGLRSLLKEGK